jgi:hypothetical protein
MGHRRYLDGKDSLVGDFLEERPYFRESSAVKMTFMM